MAEDGKIIYKVVVDDSGTASEAEKAGQSAGGAFEKGAKPGGGAFKEVMIGAARQIGAAFVNMASNAASAVVDTMKEAVDSVASLEQNVGGVEALFKDSADSVIANAKQAYETAGMSANEYMQTVTGFSGALIKSLGGDTAAAAELANKAVADMADQASIYGKTVEDVSQTYLSLARGNTQTLDNLFGGMFAGTKSGLEEMLRYAENYRAGLGETVSYSSQSYADIVSAIHDVSEALEISGNASNEASKTIEGSMNAAKAAFDNFLNGSGGAEELADAIITAATNIGTNVAEIAGRLVTEIPELFRTLVGKVPEIYSSIMEAIAQQSPDFAAKIDAFMRPMGEVLQALIDLGQTVWPIVEPVIDAALWGLQQIAEILQEVVGWAQTAVDWLTSVGDWLDAHSGEVTGYEDYGFGANDYGYGNNASGTDYWRGGLTWLGEGGPELVDLPRGSRIYSNQQSRQLAAQMAGALNFGAASYASTVSYDMSSSRVFGGAGATYNISVQNIGDLQELLNWYNSLEVTERMA